MIPTRWRTKESSTGSSTVDNRHSGPSAERESMGRLDLQSFWTPASAGATVNHALEIHSPHFPLVD